MLIRLLRMALLRQEQASGFLRSPSHPHLSKALAAMHAHPAQDGSLDALADVAGMSRSRFAAAFKREIGDSPGNYLSRWRVMLEQAMILEGVPLKIVSERVGYASQAGFLRAFKGGVGCLAHGVAPRGGCGIEPKSGSYPDAASPGGGLKGPMTGAIRSLT